MPRPKKNNADYFPHLTGLRNHRKVKILRNKFGAVLGYAFWCMMLEWLTEHDGLEFEFSEIEIEMFSSELGVSAAEIQSMIEWCLKLELLFKNHSGFIYSESLQEVLNPVFEKRNKEREKSKSRQRKEDGTFKNPESTTSGGVSAAEIPHSKEKRSKEKRREKNLEASGSEPVEDFSAYNSMRAFWLDELHPEWQFDGAAGKSLKSIKTKLERLLKTTRPEFTNEDVVNLFKKMCLSMQPFYQDKDLTKINGGFNEIIEHIKNLKNGKSNSNTRQTATSKYRTVGEGV